MGPFFAGALGSASPTPYKHPVTSSKSPSLLYISVMNDIRASGHENRALLLGVYRHASFQTLVHYASFVFMCPEK